VSLTANQALYPSTLKILYLQASCKVGAFALVMEELSGVPCWFHSNLQGMEILLC